MLINTLSLNEIHLHWIDTGKINHYHAKNYLNAAEKKRAAAFKFVHDQQHYQAAHNWLRQLLSRYADLPPTAWHFTINRYGKPFIANTACTDLQFNLSHTHGLIACAIRRNHAIGVDVEQHKAITDLTTLCQYNFAPSEQNYVLSNTTPRQQQQRFFTCWTLKEAYIKALGMGLSYPLQDFAITRNQQKEWQLDTNSKTSEHWYFMAQMVTRQHSLAVAIAMQNAKTAPIIHINP